MSERTSDKQPRRLHIERLELDLRGLDPAVAEAAVRALGPALAAVLARADLPPEDVARIDAGSLPPAGHPRAVGPGTDGGDGSPHSLATAIAGYIGRSLSPTFSQNLSYHIGGEPT